MTAEGGMPGGHLRTALARLQANFNDMQASPKWLSRLSRQSVQGGDRDREYRAREIRTAVLAELQNPSVPTI